MELAFQDDAAREACAGNEERVVDLIHAHLGLASVADVSRLPDGTLRLETHAGSIVVLQDLSTILTT